MTPTEESTDSGHGAATSQSNSLIPTVSVTRDDSSGWIPESPQYTPLESTQGEHQPNVSYLELDGSTGSSEPHPNYFDPVHQSLNGLLSHSDLSSNQSIGYDSFPPQDTASNEIDMSFLYQDDMMADADRNWSENRSTTAGCFQGRQNPEMIKRKAYIDSDNDRVL